MVGFLLVLLGLLLAGSLLSYDPDDPSLLVESSRPRPTANWIGTVGANFAALGYSVFGLAVLVAPLLALWGGWRALRGDPEEPVTGRGLGAVVLLGSLPALLQLALGSVAWRGREQTAGGVLGTLVGGTLERWVGSIGAFLIVLAGVVVGAALLVQSTLGENLARWRRRLADGWQRLVLARARRRERREKEQMKERVVARQLERARERRGEPVASPAPLTVREVTGPRRFWWRRVRGTPPALPPPAPVIERPAPQVASAEPPSRPAATLPDPVPPPARSEAPQREIPFPRVGGRRMPLPPLDLLRAERPEPSVDENELIRLGEVIRGRCAEFGVEGTIEGISPGPVITIFEFQPAPGVKVSQIVNLQDDLALALRAEAVRIDRLSGRSTLGIEVPNVERATIRLGSLLEDARFKSVPSPLTMALGTTIHGDPYYADLATMPHLLVAGATGSGKSVGLQSMITSILYKARREEVQFIFIDPKRIELGVYADIPHLKAEVVVEPKKAANALRWAVAEMERRYRLLAEVHVRSIEYYNRAIGDPEVKARLALSESESEFSDEDLQPLPYYVVIIDELADLMMVASQEVEASIARLAQMARAVGIHLIIATQRPSVDVLTGTIKANFPCRISYATASRHDSRTILDQIGAEKLLGKGDMLFMPPGTSRAMRLHGAYVTEQETAALVRWLKKQGPPELDPTVLEDALEYGAGGDGGGEHDEMFEEAARLVVAERKASASFLQRRLRVGFSRAARLIDLMEHDGLLGPAQGSKPRDVLVPPDYFDELDRERRE